MCVCVCVCVCVFAQAANAFRAWLTETRSVLETLCMCECVLVGGWMGGCVCVCVSEIKQAVTSNISVCVYVCVCV